MDWMIGVPPEQAPADNLVDWSLSPMEFGGWLDIEVEVAEAVVADSLAEAAVDSLAEAAADNLVEVRVDHMGLDSLVDSPQGQGIQEADIVAAAVDNRQEAGVDSLDMEPERQPEQAEALVLEDSTSRHRPISHY